MAQAYRFQVSLPVTDTLPRNRVVNSLHFQHTLGSLADTDLLSFSQSIAALYQTRYGNTTSEVQVKAYDVDATPNYPRATVLVNSGVVWTCTSPREIALVLSYAAQNRGNRSERGRCYLMPQIRASAVSPALRPSAAQMTWALEWYSKSNESFPDLGGVDWQFGVWSSKYKSFKTSEQAWVNDDWDIQRRRGLRESTRQTVTRQG